MRHWQDGNNCGCQHKDECYVGSFTHDELAMDSLPPRTEHLDVYIFDTPSFGAEVCIRYENEPSAYYSPGPLTQFIQAAGRNHEMYALALKLILEKGIIRWEAKTK